MEPIIDVNNITFSYQHTPILKDVSFNIQKGDFVVFFGPNGGGKTTLLKLLLGLLSPDKGSISMFNLPPKKSTQKIGYIPQTPLLEKNFPITSLELVLLGCVKKSTIFGRYPSKIINLAKNLLKKVDLQQHIHSPIQKLSGGQVQRALIAKALILDPDILIFDEPISSIDLQSQKKIFDLILKYKNKKTIIMVTHNLNFIINKIKKAFLVNQTVEKHLPKTLCNHFTLGLYHSSIKEKK